MRKTFSIIFFQFLIYCSFLDSFSQSVVEVKAKLNEQSFSYFLVDPGKEIKGILVLFPGKGESPESIFQKTTLPRDLSFEGYLTIVPALPYTLIADEFTRKAVNHILISQVGKHQLLKPNLVLGGFSAGGTLAISLAEYYFQTDSNSSVRGVFAIDPPLDFVRLYASAENKMRYQCASLIRKEGEMMIDYFNHAVGGSPSSRPEQYLKLSPFSGNDPRGGNAKYLENIPIRLYSEPDLHYVKKRYCEELQFSDMNAFDLERLNKTLFLNGNSNCEYITTQGKGYHSWNILEVPEAIEWIERICN